MKFSETHEIPKVLDTETDSSSDSSFVEVSEINNMNRGRFYPVKVMGSNLTNIISFLRVEKVVGSNLVTIAHFKMTQNEILITIDNFLLINDCFC